MVLGIKVYDAMSIKPKYVSCDMTIENAVKIMFKEKVGSLLCCENNKLLGILTERDIIRKIVAQNKDSKKIKVGEIMTRKVITVKPTEDLEKATKLMASKGIRRLPVIDGKKLVGMLTIKDILKIEPLLIEVLVEKLQIQRKGWFSSNKVQGICDNCKKYSRALEFDEGRLVCPNCR